MKLLGPTSKYQAVAQAIREMISQRGLMPGDRVPPEEEIASRLGVSYLTVRRANEDLVREGLIRRKQGRGTFVAESGSKETRALTIGFLGVARELEGFTLRHYTNLKQHLGELGRPSRLIFDSITPYATDTLLPPQFDHGAVDVIVTYGVFDTNLLTNLAKRGVPLVVVGNTVRVPGVPIIELDLVGLTHELTRALVRDLGFEDVWLVSDPMTIFSSREEIEGYRKAVEEGLIASELLSVCPDGNYLPFVRSFSRMWPKLGTRQALIWMPQQPIVPLELMGITPKPGEFGVVNYCNPSAVSSLTGEFTMGTVLFPWDVYGKLIVEAIRQTQESGAAQGRVIRPIVTASRDAQGMPKLAVRWEAK